MRRIEKYPTHLAMTNEQQRHTVHDAALLLSNLQTLHGLPILPCVTLVTSTHVVISEFCEYNFYTIL